MLQSFKPVATSHTRSVRGRVRPFTAAKQPVRPVVLARVAEPVAEEAEVAAVAVEEEEELVATERIVLDADAKEAIRVADDLMSSFALEMALEGVVEPSLAPKADAFVENELDSTSGVLTSSLDAAATILAAQSEAAVVEDIEDYQGAAGFLKYDEEVDAANVDSGSEVVQRVKLTRQELANLLPKDWASTNVDWFSTTNDDIPLPAYRLTFLWQEQNLAAAVDQVYARGQTSPLTEYFVWPRKDAWTELHDNLRANPVVSER